MRLIRAALLQNHRFPKRSRNKRHRKPRLNWHEFIAVIYEGPDLRYRQCRERWKIRPGDEYLRAVFVLPVKAPIVHRDEALKEGAIAMRRVKVINVFLVASVSAVLHGAMAVLFIPVMSLFFLAQHASH